MPGHSSTHTIIVEQCPTHIINGCLAQDAQCQEQLYHYLYEPMLKVCLRYTHNLDDAGSLYNDAMLKIYSKIAQYQYKGSFIGWVKRIVMNTCIDHCRKKLTFKHQEWVASDYAEHIGIQPTAYAAIQAKDIMQLVQELPKNTAAVFNLHVIDGYKHYEIATQLNISEGTSKWHLNEARRLLKLKLDQLLNSKTYNNASGY